MKQSFIILFFSVIILAGLSSCNKDCYTCKAENYGNLVDFEENCGTEEEKQQMEEEFRKQYPDSLYFVYCN